MEALNGNRFTANEHQLTSCLDRLTRHVEQLRQLDLSVEDARRQALAQSQQALGALAMYRGLLEHLAEPLHGGRDGRCKETENGKKDEYAFHRPLPVEPGVFRAFFEGSRSG